MDKITIIIPVYNVENYIPKCLDSVITQTYRNLEILMIDDGSNDNSGRICNEYAQKDTRICVLHQRHSGLSAALNAGISHATGDYIGFADSDDWVEQNWCEYLLLAIKKAQSQISISSYFTETDKVSKAEVNLSRISAEKINTESLLLYPLKRDSYRGFCGYLWNKLFNAQVVKNAGVHFNEKIKYGMDTLFYTSLVLTKQCTGAFIDKPLYHYYQRTTSITKSTDIDVKRDILTVYKHVEDMLCAYGYKHLAFWARGFYCHHASVIAELAYKQNNKYMLKQMQNEINDTLHDYIKTNPQNSEKLKRMEEILCLQI